MKSKRYYESYVNHCFRVYFRYQLSDMTTEVSRTNWLCVDTVYKSLTVSEQKLLKHLFQASDLTPKDLMEEYANINDLDAKTLWKVYSAISRKVAQERKLI